MVSLSDDKQTDIIDAFNTTSRYLDDILNINNASFDTMVNERGTCIKGQIWPPLEPKTESCFSPISPYWFIRRMVQV